MMTLADLVVFEARIADLRAGTNEETAREIVQKYRLGRTARSLGQA
jgi:hypothetical protein